MFSFGKKFLLPSGIITTLGEVGLPKELLRREVVENKEVVDHIYATVKDLNIQQQNLIGSFGFCIFLQSQHDHLTLQVDRALRELTLAISIQIASGADRRKLSTKAAFLASVYSGEPMASDEELMTLFDFNDSVRELEHTSIRSSPSRQPVKPALVKQPQITKKAKPQEPKSKFIRLASDDPCVKKLLDFIAEYVNGLGVDERLSDEQASRLMCLLTIATKDALNKKSDLSSQVISDVVHDAALVALKLSHRLPIALSSIRKCSQRYLKKDKDVLNVRTNIQSLGLRNTITGQDSNGKAPSEVARANLVRWIEKAVWDDAPPEAQGKLRKIRDGIKFSKKILTKKPKSELAEQEVYNQLMLNNQLVSVMNFAAMYVNQQSKGRRISDNEVARMMILTGSIANHVLHTEFDILSDVRERAIDLAQKATMEAGGRIPKAFKGLSAQAEHLWPNSQVLSILISRVKDLHLLGPSTPQSKTDNEYSYLYLMHWVKTGEIL